MKRTLGTVVLTLAMFFFVIAIFKIGGIATIPVDHRPPYVVGLFLPSIVCLIIGSWLRRKREANPSTLLADRKGRFIELTDTAVEYVRAEFERGGYSTDAAKRIRQGVDGSFEVVYDYVSDDDRDWIDDSHGVNVIVDKTIAEDVKGFSVDVSHGKLRVAPPGDAN